MSVQIGSMEVSYSSRGNPTFQLELWHRDLKKHRVIRGNDASIVQRKAHLQIAEWNEKWAAAQRRQAVVRHRQGKREFTESRKEEAAERSAQAVAALKSLDGILAHTLTIDDTIDWEHLRDASEFPEPKPSPEAVPERAPDPPGPVFDSPYFRPRLGLLDKLIPSRKRQKIAVAKRQFELAREAWLARVKAAETKRQDHLARIGQTHAQAIQGWEERRDLFLQEQRKANDAVARKQALYEAKDPDAVLDYCDMVLSNSEYPDWMPHEWDLDYQPEAGTLIVEYSLPSLEALPTLSDVRYVQSRDEFTEKHRSESQMRQVYDSVLYQITLRTIHELFEADAVGALEAVVFNGRVTSTDRATGHETTACILSIHAKREEFLTINLAAVDPKACFKSLKGVGSSKLHSLTPVAPIMQMRRDDGRFISAREIANTLDDSVNLAVMDWADFEHLIRELFEQEFATSGGEVKVTQASRDGGVDAIAFDPDPIRGGKIVIQAKRYTNTVGVAAVRDLYGTVVNEGATKGILVTTSDYGPDAYSFAKDKPLSLLNGANLLYLLEKHGRKAKIDIAEARRLIQ